MSGVVYLIHSDMGLYKIGKTTHLKARFSNLKTASPADLTLIHTIEHEDHAGIEKHFHEKFSDKWVRGEWFRLSDEDIEYITGFTELSEILSDSDIAYAADGQSALIEDYTFNSWFESLPWGAP